MRAAAVAAPVLVADPPMPRRLPPLLVLAVAACGQDGPTVGALLDEPGDRVPITRFRAEPYPLTFSSGIAGPARTVVRDAPLWRATWAEIQAGLTPEPPLPDVDFAREMVVVAALGGRSSGGYGILVDSATLHEGTLRVHLRTFSPGPRCVVTAALTAPLDAARLARHDGPVEFRERAEVVRCD